MIKHMKKTILITGSTDGIGKLAALKLAKDGHNLYLHGRKAEKLNQVIAEIKEQSPDNEVSGFLADFSDLEAVEGMAGKILQTLPGIDVLINNAGVFKSPIQQTQAGLDIRFAVNYLAPYVLTNALLPLLHKGSEPRILNLSSAAQASVSMDALLGKMQLSEQAAYAQSKLALTMWSFHLAKTESNMTVIAINPGSLLNTNMVREGFGRYWSSADKGGNILYELAVDGVYADATGKYFDNDKGEEKGAFGRAHEDAYDDTLIEQLIQQTEQIIESYK